MGSGRAEPQIIQPAKLQQMLGAEGRLSAALQLVQRTAGALALTQRDWEGSAVAANTNLSC